MSMQRMPSVPRAHRQARPSCRRRRRSRWSKAGLFAAAVSDGTGRSSVMRAHCVDSGATGTEAASLDAATAASRGSDNYRIAARRERRAAARNENGRHWRPSADDDWRATYFARVALAELVDAAAGVHELVLARVERVRSRRDVDLDSGYSLPSSHLIVSLLVSVERVRNLKSEVTSWKTTSWYSGWMSAFMAGPYGCMQLRRERAAF